MAQRETREINQLADQANSYSQSAIKYLEDNYRSLVQQTNEYTEVILPFTIFSGYAPDEVTALTRSYQTPCLYVMKSTNNTLIAYLIFGKVNPKAKDLEQLTVAKIAQTLGENAGTLVQQNGSYILRGGVENDFNFSSASINKIVGGCGFRTLFPPYSLVIDLTKNVALFTSIKGNLDQQSTAKEPDPSLKKDGTISEKNILSTMETNLYLDNIVKESSSKTTYYCDATKLPVNDANSICLNYASNNKVSMYSGTAKWISSLLDSSSKNCIATASAHFYTATTSYTCSGVSFPDANSFCPANKNGQSLVKGSGYWSPNPGTLNGTQCTSNAYASYASCPTITCVITNPSKGIGTWVYTCNGVMQADWRGPVSGGTIYAAMQNACKNAGYQGNFNSSNPWDKTYTPSYNPNSNLCAYNPQIYCGYDKNGHYIQNGIWVNFNGTPSTFGGSSSKQSCGQKSVSAKTTQSTNDMGYKNC